jgi:hypothetical protein
MPQSVKDAAGVGALQIVTLPLRISLKSLPSQRPPSVLHANVIEASEKFVSGQTVDIDDPFAHQNDVLDLIFVERNDAVLILEKNQ